MIGKTVSHYKILDKLGQGGMGIVYKAHDITLDRIVALKFLPPHTLGNEEEKARFVYEAQAAAALNHPNICTIYETDQYEDQPFIAMEFIEGQSLKERIESGPVQPEQALDIAIQVVDGLQAAHEKTIVHRDIKPANIMLTQNGRAKIMDFGLAKIAGRIKLTRTSTTLGTVAYMSPEQTRGEAIDHRTDIWSVGIVLYEMLTGQPPFKGEYEQAVVFSILNEDPKPMKVLRPGIPPKLQEIVERTLDKKPDSRISSAAGLLEQLKGYQTASKPAGAGNLGIKPLLAGIRRPGIVIPAFLMIAMIMFFSIQFYTKRSRIRWARYEALPKAASLLEEQNIVDAFLLGKQAQRYIPDDPSLQRLLDATSFVRTVLTTPSGADVYFKDYTAVDAEWQYLGRTPIDSTFVPVAYLRLRIIRQGFETAIRAANIWHMGDTLRIKLIPEGTGVSGMVLVPGGNQRLGSGDPVELQEYWIDKYEVTNRQYKEFVDAGGYEKREYWKQPLVRDGSEFSWEQAMGEFRDATGRPGPLTWKLGTFTDGPEYPVRGVSWYEAAAYAEFAGKSLPTVYHWRQAAGFGIFSDILTLSNFYEEGPVPGQTYQGLSLYGCFDMAGNVKEWCLNESEGWRYILGGAWNEPEYMFSGMDAQQPFERAETFGFRCMQSTVPLSEDLTGPVTELYHDFRREKPVEDDIFEIYRNLYSYDRTELAARTMSVDESSEHWRRETISFNAAYGDERMIAHLYVPYNATPPYQVVVFFPGSNAQDQTSSENVPGMIFADFIPRSGRALLFPVYKGTYERGGGKPIPGPLAYRDLAIQQGKDVQRSVDYLETREDIDTGKIAYFGLSWGACMGPIYTAIERRFKASILLGGGYSIYDLDDEPEVNPLHFAPRSRVPVLMINGRYDFIFPIETSAGPMFDLQGAPEGDKRFALFDCGHIPPGNDVIRETLDWLDRYLGPVQ